MNHCIETVCGNCGHEYCLRCHHGICPNCKHKYLLDMKNIESKTLALKHEIASLMNRIETINLEIEVLNTKGSFDKIEQKLRDRNILRYKLGVREALLHPNHRHDAIDYQIEIMR